MRIRLRLMNASKLRKIDYLTDFISSHFPHTFRFSNFHLIFSFDAHTNGRFSFIFRSLLRYYVDACALATVSFWGVSLGCMPCGSRNTMASIDGKRSRAMQSDRECSSRATDGACELMTFFDSIFSFMINVSSAEELWEMKKRSGNIQFT